MALSLIAMIPILSHCHTPYLVDHDDSLDLGPIDLRNLDPATARKMLDDIKSGADIKVITVINVSRPARSGAYPSISNGSQRSRSSMSMTGHAYPLRHCIRG